MKKIILTAALAAVFAAPLIGLAVPAAQAQKPGVACQDMAGKLIPASAIGLPTKGAKITAARIVPASAGTPATPATPGAPPAAGRGAPPSPGAGAPPGGAPGAPPGGAPGGRGGPPGGGRGAGPSPEYCRIEGAIAPVDPKAPNIEFAVGIPTIWNGDSWQAGGGGWDGSVPGLTGPGSQSVGPGAPSLLVQGYAVYGGDSGHQGQGVEWVSNAEAWMNFSHQALKKTNDAAQAVLRMKEGRGARHHYFTGTSQGGREGLEVVAQYPADYDGVLVQVPVAYFSGIMTVPTILATAQAAPGAYIPASKHPMITKAVLDICDGLDNLADGVISNPVGCIAKLNVPLASTPLRSLRCASGGDEGDKCLSDAQLKVLNAFHQPVKFGYAMPNGKTDFPGWGPGSEAALLARAKPDLAKPAEGGFGPAAAVIRQMFGGSADYNLYTFDPLKHQARMQQLSREVDVPADWSAFVKRGGKLIWVTAGADTAANPGSQMRLYNDVVAKTGKAAIDSSVRYFVIPMADHGGQARSATTGESQPTSWNPVGALRDWVEAGVAPADAPIMSLYSGAEITATRPLCRYPAYPRYLGGDKNRDAAYACRKG